MGIELVEKEIIEETNKIADSRIKDAEKKASEIKKETENLVKFEQEKSEQETDKLIEQLKEAFEASAKFEVKKMELSSKREILNQVFEKTVEKIQALDDKTIEKLVKVLIKDVKNEIEVETIFCNEKTKKFIPKEFKVKTEDMLGGIIAENKDRTIRVDNRFETILEEVRKDALKKIAKVVL